MNLFLNGGWPLKSALKLQNDVMVKYLLEEGGIPAQVSTCWQITQHQSVCSGCPVHCGMETDPITSWSSELQLHYGFRYNPTHQNNLQVCAGSGLVCEAQLKDKEMVVNRGKTVRWHMCDSLKYFGLIWRGGVNERREEPVSMPRNIQLTIFLLLNWHRTASSI